MQQERQAMHNSTVYHQPTHLLYTYIIYLQIMEQRSLPPVTLNSIYYANAELRSNFHDHVLL